MLEIYPSFIFTGREYFPCSLSSFLDIAISREQKQLGFKECIFWKTVHLSQWLVLSPLSLALSLPECFSLKKSTLIFTNTPTYLVNLISNPTFSIVFDPFIMGHKTSSNKPEKCMMTCVPVFQVTKFALGLHIKENLGQIKEPGKSPLQFITARFIIKSRLLFQRD